MPPTPKILAPAGDTHSFLAAVAAGADAVYCGLKIFSARMEAENFSIEELSRLTRLAAEKDVEVYIAFNSLIKEGELEKTWNILQKITRYVACHALIIQDPALVNMARKAGFKGKIQLSTLGNCTSPSAMIAAGQAGFNRIVLPREFTVDDIKAMARHAPEDMDIEVFIHGALCYAVSGRCYWSSWFGGKSGLRGRCVQPCRRIYTQDGKQGRFFSCMDFSVDVLAKTLKAVPEITAWKIEGRKKSPHYVYYTVKGYRLLRDHPERKKEALTTLEYALSRPTTHYRFLSQRPQDPLDHSSQTASGLFAGRVKNPHDPYFITREDLHVDDLLRIGYEDDESHRVQRVTRAVPKKGKFLLNKGTKGKVQKGTPVFIIDRREKTLRQAIQKLEEELVAVKKVRVMPDKGIFKFTCPKKLKINTRSLKIIDMQLADGRRKRSSKSPAQWIGVHEMPAKPSKTDRLTWWWLPPIIFPDEEAGYKKAIDRLSAAGARKFVLNAPWQTALFDPGTTHTLWAGPFCNIANTQAILKLHDMGFSGVVVSPELDKQTFLSLPENTPLPLGIVVYGNWPIAVSKIAPEKIRPHQLFFSPKEEGAWISKINGLYAVYPQWRLDIREKKKELIQAGYTMFVYMDRTLPGGVTMKKRPGLWNWDLRLL